MASQRRRDHQQGPDAEAVEEDDAQYGRGGMSLEEVDQHFPHRPKNAHKTLPFAELYKSLFNPLMDCKPGSSATAGAAAAAVLGKTRFGKAKKTGGVNYHEQRRHIIERFMSRWRKEVGDDFYPAMRLILPDKDRDRGVYGLKESGIGKMLVRVMKIGRDSEDGYSLLHWKLPGGGGGGNQRFGGKGQTGTAGDFAGRVLEVVGKRAMRGTPGGWTIGEVNVLLDRLAGASGEREQLPIFEEIYRNCCAEEVMWLVRIILKDMRVGATERTFLGLWHPDAEALFSVSSSLRRVCWELWDPETRLEQKETGVSLMQCFQPQLAQFQMTTGFGKLVQNLGVTEEEKEFWIEEKLDGERMQMHMKEDETVPGGFRFAFWSRKAKDYTYLYGEGLEDDNSALTRHLKNAFHDGVRELILDGEMITWDPEIDKIVPFGTLKTAALDQQKNPFQNGPRPLYRVFDILLLNKKPLADYTLRDRHAALEVAVRGEHRRLEIHPYESATTPDAIEPFLRRVVAEASEGLILKNPRSRYQLNSRNNDWIKVKPEYMSEYGESLDCVIIGGYFGSGRRGGILSSFLCGVRVSENHVRSGAALTREKCLSFCKVGGGLKAEDYAEIRHHTEGKWQDWQASNPPTDYIELAGGKMQYEKPDVWIRPSESVVISIKAASIGPSDQFAMGWTLRFPRFRKLRLDKSWDEGMDASDFVLLKDKVKEEEKERKAMEIESRKRKPAKRLKKELVIAGTDPNAAPVEFVEGGDNIKAEPMSQVAFPPPQARRKSDNQLFQGLDFCVLSEAVKPRKMSKPDLEKLIKEHGGRIHQQVDKGGNMILLAEKNVVRVASLKRAGDADIVKPKWVFDCLAQNNGEGYLLPFEEGHLFHATEEMVKLAAENTDQYGDSYVRDVTPDELRDIIDDMRTKGDVKEEEDAFHDERTGEFDAEHFLDQLEERGRGLEGLKSFLFRRCRVYFPVAAKEEEEEEKRGPSSTELKAVKLQNEVKFGNGTVVGGLDDKEITHVVVVGDGEKERKELAASVRYKVSSRRHVPRIVTGRWVEDCVTEGTLVDEEGYAP
ncbi:DNA ligase (ATP) [Podospora pseudopauciseta]|uniref:DNA ligase n=1 Tax=Podospora pseudopauciseta TaxID=2093780 RepID=A0ABR0H185_9PEZI|nr:DNA ligase (ATP) [Podospora pseudopauciseta]